MPRTGGAACWSGLILQMQPSFSTWAFMNGIFQTAFRSQEGERNRPDSARPASQFSPIHCDFCRAALQGAGVLPRDVRGHLLPERRGRRPPWPRARLRGGAAVRSGQDACIRLPSATELHVCAGLAGRVHGQRRKKQSLTFAKRVVSCSEATVCTTTTWMRARPSR